ncbi:MAG TPA: ROK family protein [Clostridia bacterium]|nr:ROK family protein [Clostridia bacterium]
MANKVYNPKTLRKSNNANLLWQLYNHGELSRLQLAEKCGLTTASITQLVQNLMAEEVVVESGSVQRNSTGRKEILLSANWDKFLALGINIESGNTHISVCSVKEVKVEEIYPTSQLISGGNIDKLKEKTVEMSSKFGKNLKYICIGIIGKVDEENGVSINSYEILPKDFNLIGAFKDVFGNDKEIEIINNVRAQAHSLISENNLDFLYIKHSPSIGCALVADGRLMSGENNMAGKLGHIIVEPDGQLCTCGKHGCLETIVSEKNISRKWQEISGQNVSVNEIYLMYQTDNEARRLLDFIADRMAVAVGNTCLVMNPANVLVTGGMFFNQNIYSAFLNSLEKRGFNIHSAVSLITNDARIKAFAEAKSILLKKLFEE